VLRGLDIAEERRLAGVLAGALYLTGAATVGVLMLVPGTDASHWRVVAVVAGLGAAWGVACLTVIDWERAGPLVSHFSSFMGLPITAVTMAATGGSHSPTQAFLFFIVFFCAYFFRTVEAAPYLLGCMAVAASPLLYEHGALAKGLAGQLLIYAPTYLILGALILAAKQVLVGLRTAAQRLALTDPLTGLANRRALIDALDEELARGDERTALMLVDLDDFKHANTVYGHPGGDEVLRASASALGRSCRDSRMVARLGGDEFAVVYRCESPATVLQAADRLHVALEQASARLPFDDFDLAGSVGWAMAPDDAATSEALIALADSGVRLAKQAGKAQTAHAHEPPLMHPRTPDLASARALT
jgi:diguanylate cyclase (GGDEF)-like protein